MDQQVLQNIPASVLAIYFSAWMNSMLGVPQFIASLAPSKGCTNQCAKYIQPGSIPLARKYESNLNTTLLEDDLFVEADALIIDRAPGIVTEFSQPIDNVYFSAEDCQLYGQIRGDAIKICIQLSGTGSALIGEI